MLRTVPPPNLVDTRLPVDAPAEDRPPAPTLPPGARTPRSLRGPRPYPFDSGRGRDFSFPSPRPPSVRSSVGSHKGTLDSCRSTSPLLPVRRHPDARPSKGTHSDSQERQGRPHFHFSRLRVWHAPSRSEPTTREDTPGTRPTVPGPCASVSSCAPPRRPRVPVGPPPLRLLSVLTKGLPVSWTPLAGSWLPSSLLSSYPQRDPHVQSRVTHVSVPKVSQSP